MSTSSGLASSTTGQTSQDNIQHSTHSSPNVAAIVGGAVGGGVAVCIMLTAVIVYFKRFHRAHPVASNNEVELGRSTNTSSLTENIYLSDITVAERIGGGQFGDIYR
jgi:hypothetical protein